MGSAKRFLLVRVFFLHNLITLTAFVQDKMDLMKHPTWGRQSGFCWSEYSFSSPPTWPRSSTNGWSAGES